MELYDFCQSALNGYGEFGDGSLEYIGLIISHGKVTERRIYRKNSEALMNDICREEPYSRALGETFADFLKLDGVSLCDVSKSTSGEVPLFRTVFKLPENMTLSTQNRVLETFFKNLDNTADFKDRIEQELSAWDADSSLIQIGAEFDRSLKSKSVKYYISVNENSPALRICDSEARIGTVCENYYKPIFVGVNDNGVFKEKKLYFISKEIGFKNSKVLNHVENMAEAFGWYKAVSSTELDRLDSLGIYPEGIAMSLQKPEVWRLYYREYLKRK